MLKALETRKADIQWDIDHYSKILSNRMSEMKAIEEQMTTLSNRLDNSDVKVVKIQ